MAESAEGDLGGIEELWEADGVDIAAYHAIGDTGDKVADVLISGQVGHGVAVGSLGSLFGVEPVEFFGPAFLDGKVAGLAAAQYGGVAGGGDWDRILRWNWGRADSLRFLLRVLCAGRV